MKRLCMKDRRARAGFLFCLPLIVGLLFFFIKPTVQSLVFSFSRVFFTDSGYGLESIGISNYSSIFLEHPSYLETLYGAIINMVAQVPLIVVFSFFIANIINQKFKGRTFVRVILFLPVILSASALQGFEVNNAYQNAMMDSGGAIKDAFAADAGLVSLNLGEMLQSLNLAEGAIKYIVVAVDKIYEVINLSGIQILIFLAALQSISSSLYEVAKIEGATSWETFWKVTFPMVFPMILVCTVYSIIDSFTQYDNMVIELSENTAFNDLNFGQSAAMSWVYCVISLIFIGIVYAAFTKKIRSLEA